MVRTVWGDNQMPIYLCAWHILKVWHLHSMEKIKDNEMWREIGWPSHHHIHAHWTKWKHWSLHDSWEKQGHWKLHPTFVWWFMDSICLDLLFPNWYANYLSIHYCCCTMLCISQNMHTVCGGKVQYSHYDLNSHYMSEPYMQYLHDNLKMHIVYGGKIQYSHYDSNLYYIR